MILKLRKSGIKHHKRFVIRSWNEGDMVVWNKVAQRVCCNRIACGSNSFCLFSLIFWATCWAWKLLNCGSYTGASFSKFWCQILVLSRRQLALVHNWKVVKIIPWPCVDPQFCPPSTCLIRYLFDTLQLVPWWPISTHTTYLSWTTSETLVKGLPNPLLWP